MAFAVAALAFVGQFISSSAEAEAYRQEADGENYRAGIARQAAVTKGQQASAAEEALRREQRQFLGRQRAAVAESGTGFGGSNDDIMRQSMAQAELDALNIQYEGNIERLNLLEQAKMHDYNKKSLKARAKQTMRTRWISALSAGAGAYGGAGGSFSYMGAQKGPG